MNEAVEPIVVDTDDPSLGSNPEIQRRSGTCPDGGPELANGPISEPLPEGDRNGAPTIRKTQSGTSSSGSSTKPSLSSRLDNLKISTIRQHYYPEGGWGWVICTCAFLINVLSTGFLLSYGILQREVLKEFGEEFEEQSMWLGSFSMTTGLFLSPMIVAFCRRKSTRLTAVFGGLTAALGCLFTSFASQMHQVFVSYGFVMALGLGLTRVTSFLMIGQYFKRKREKVEIVVNSGTGCGVVVFSYSFAKIIRTLGWRLGLHAITGMAVLPFFLGICYRSASLYHPQRRAILHLKNQRKKIKDKSGVSDKPPFFDWSLLKSGPLLINMFSTALCSLGLYTPFFHFVPIVESEGYEDDSVLQFQMHLGSAFVIGCWFFGLLLVKRTAECIVGKQYICQAAMVAIGLSFLSINAVQGYYGYVLFIWMYGVPCGGLHYALKMLVFEKIRAKSFSRAWGYVEWAQSIPVLVGIPATGYINKSQGPKIGFFFSAACSFAGAAALCLNNLTRHPSQRRGHGSCSTCTSQTPSEPYRCPSSQDFVLTSNSRESSGHHVKCQKTISFSDTIDVAEDSPRWVRKCPHVEDPEKDRARNAWNEDREEDLEVHNFQNDVIMCCDQEVDGQDIEEEAVIEETPHATLARYGCGHYEGEFDVGPLHPHKRQMTIIEEVTSTV